MSFLFVSFCRQLEARALYNLVQRGRGVAGVLLEGGD